MNLGHVNLKQMSGKLVLSSVNFAALVAFERLFPSVRLYVTLKITRSSASVVALVTLVWLFSCVLPLHVNFQMLSINAGILAHCASVRLFSRVGSFVLLQVA